MSQWFARIRRCSHRTNSRAHRGSMTAGYDRNVSRQTAGEAGEEGEWEYRGWCRWRASWRAGLFSRAGREISRDNSVSSAPHLVSRLCFPLRAAPSSPPTSSRRCPPKAARNAGGDISVSPPVSRRSRGTFGGSAEALRGEGGSGGARPTSGACSCPRLAWFRASAAATCGPSRRWRTR